MELLDYCLKCYLSLSSTEWELVYSFAGMWVIRCPRCRTLHTCFSDGTIEIN